MVVVPNSRIRLLKCPIEMDNENQLTFANVTAQTNYFLGLSYLEETNCSYQRKDGVIRFETDPDGTTFEDLLKYNYVMYQNTSYSNKWFYAFITKIKYVNDGMSEISIETDVFQSWQFDIVYKRTFVEREHVNNDTLGLHTIPEGLELGPYIVNAQLTDSYNNQLCVILGMSEDYLNNYNFGVFNYDGIPGAVIYYRFGYQNADLVQLGAVLNSLQAGKADAIVSLFLAPQWLAPFAGSTVKVQTSNSPKTQDLGISRISTLNGYTPTNKKLLTYPYCYIGLSNGVGQYSVYHQEDWALNNSNEMVVRMFGSLTPGCSIRAVPINYMGTQTNWDEGITLGKFPQLSWANDLYTNWLTQNGVNLGITTLNAEQAGILGGAVKAGAAAYTGDMQMAGSALRDIWNTMQEGYRMDMIPTGVRGSLNSGDIATSNGANRLHAYRVTIKQEYAQIIDKFFNVYGYKVNDFKTPNITGRTNWNYVKTVNCNIEGEIPQEDIQKLKNIFNNGVTFWHNPSKFLDYSQSNAIVS